VTFLSRQLKCATNKRSPTHNYRVNLDRVGYSLLCCVVAFRHRPGAHILSWSAGHLRKARDDRFVPQAALGGVLLFVALRIIRVRQTVAIYRQSFGEFLLIVSTTAAIIVLPIEQGVAIGIALSLLNGICSTTRARVLVFERVPGTTVWWRPSPHSQGEKEPNVIVAGFQAPLSFLNAYRFRQDILDALQSSTQKARLILLEATGILEIDFTAAQVLSDLIRRCHEDGVAFAITRLESIRAQDAVARFGIDELLGPGRMFRSVEEAIRALPGETPAEDASALGRPHTTQ
jgi:sulfate permease, SulP family